MARSLMRMAELERLSGVPRETIHYYLREGLLPAPTRQGKTQALYDDSHLERLRLVRQLREEKYLPVAVIRSVLRAGLERPPSRDLDTLADVLRIDPHLGGEPAPAPVVDQEVARVAQDLGLLMAGESSADPTVARVLGTVAEVVALEGLTRELTLEDLRVSATAVGALVEAEAAVFFDAVIRRGEMSEAVVALRAGRAPVARFIAAYRDLMLRRIVDALISAVQSASARVEQASPLPLGSELAARLGADEHRAKLAAGALQGDFAQANDLAWHLFAVGPARDLGRLPAESLRPRAELLAAWSNQAEPDQIDRILSRAGSFPLGEVLAAERALSNALAHGQAGASVLEGVVPALGRLFRADPGNDADPLASALAFLRRGLVGLALPRALGRGSSAVSDLESAIGVVLSAPGRLHPAAHARIEGNARLALGRHLLGVGRLAEGRAQLARAVALDPTGPIGQSAESTLAEAPPEILAARERAR
ncbi:MAG: MerR family transcriptional regulator [Sorangiineae bacterium PRO1]|nr:MerR family transcriptional regulator [Sorangiineae bacterium PRO1]